MSKGNPKLELRVPPLLKAEIRKAIDVANQHRYEEPYSVSSWVLSAIMDKLKHLERGRKCRTRKGKTATD